MGHIFDRPLGAIRSDATEWYRVLPSSSLLRRQQHRQKKRRTKNGAPPLLLFGDGVWDAKWPAGGHSREVNERK